MSDMVLPPRLADVAKETIDKLKERMQNPDLYKPIPTGIVELDNIIGGVDRGIYFAIGGKGKQGKSTVALDFAISLARTANLKTGLFSLEETNERVAIRSLTHETQTVNRTDIRMMKLDDAAFEELEAARVVLDGLDFYITDQVYDIGVIGKICEEQGYDLAVLDYLQLIDSRAAARGAKSAVEKIDMISRKIVEFKNMISRKKPITFIVIYQLNKEGNAYMTTAVYRDADLILELERVVDPILSAGIDGLLSARCRLSRSIQVNEDQAITIGFSGAHSRLRNVVKLDLNQISIQEQKW